MTKENYETLKDVIDPKHTALVVWDVQKMLVSHIFNHTDFLKNLNDLISVARAKKIPIFFTKITPLPPNFESPARKYMLRKMGSSFGNMPKEMFDLEIEPLKEEIVLLKNTASIFIGTNFDLMLRNAGIETIIFTGIATEIGVESSAREAINRGYYTVVARDAVSSGDKDAHERSLKNMEKLMIVETVSNIKANLS
ncbi:MAG: isochorismatase family cysteine hydrolase [Thermoplasmata archaeon]